MLALFPVGCTVQTDCLVYAVSVLPASTSKMVKTSKQQIVEALSAWTSNGKHLTKGKSVVQAVVKTYRENGNGLNAAQMSKYMRNQFEFFGLKSPERRKLDKEILVNVSL